jgi:hypothetical protein
MKVSEPDEERPIAWSAILADEPVIAANGEEIGVVADVLGAEDIFHGIVVRAGPGGGEVMILADKITEITNVKVVTSLSSEQLRELPPYRVEESYQLGFVGLLRKHLGWARDQDKD